MKNDYILLELRHNNEIQKDIPKIGVTLKSDVESNYMPEEKATYRKIKEYVKEKYGVHMRYFVEMEHCPQEKMEYNKDALRYDKVI